MQRFSTFQFPIKNFVLSSNRPSPSILFRFFFVCALGASSLSFAVKTYCCLFYNILIVAHIHSARLRLLIPTWQSAVSTEQQIITMYTRNFILSFFSSWCGSYFISRNTSLHMCVQFDCTESTENFNLLDLVVLACKISLFILLQQILTQYCYKKQIYCCCFFLAVVFQFIERAMWLFVCALVLFGRSPCASSTDKGNQESSQMKSEKMELANGNKRKGMKHWINLWINKIVRMHCDSTVAVAGRALFYVISEFVHRMVPRWIVTYFFFGY